MKNRIFKLNFMKDTKTKNQKIRQSNGFRFKKLLEAKNPQNN